MSDNMRHEEEQPRPERLYPEETPRGRNDLPDQNAERPAETYGRGDEVGREQPLEHASVGTDRSATYAPLFTSDEADRFRMRWTEIQAGFVDEPRGAVEQADGLVKEVTDRLSTMFTQSRDELERQWTAGDEVSTEDLRQALQRYRSFFERLLSI